MEFRILMGDPKEVQVDAIITMLRPQSLTPYLIDGNDRIFLPLNSVFCDAIVDTLRFDQSKIKYIPVPDENKGDVKFNGIIAVADDNPSVSYFDLITDSIEYADEIGLSSVCITIPRTRNVEVPNIKSGIFDFFDPDSVVCNSKSEAIKKTAKAVSFYFVCENLNNIKMVMVLTQNQRKFDMFVDEFFYELDSSTKTKST